MNVGISRKIENRGIKIARVNSRSHHQKYQFTLISYGVRGPL